MAVGDFIEIEDLDITLFPSRGYWVPVELDGVTLKFSVSQILGLIARGDMPEQVAYEDEENTFTQLQTMGGGLKIVGNGPTLEMRSSQPAGGGAFYIPFFGSDGTRVGYLGVGASDLHMRFTSDGGDVRFQAGKNVSIIAQDGTIGLTSTGAINLQAGTYTDAKTKQIKNLGAAVDPNDAVRLAQLATDSPLSMSKAPSDMEWVSNTQIRVKANKFRDQTNSRNITLAADTLYTLPSPGVTAHYHVLVGYDAGGNIAITTQSTNAHSLPSGWQAYRRIGSIFTNASSQIRKFFQVGDEVLFDDSVIEIDASAFSATAANTTISVPPNCLARLRGTMNAGAGTTSDTDLILVTCPDQLARTPTFKDFSFGVYGVPGGYAVNDFEVFTDAARRIRRQSSAALKPARLITLGYKDTRGRDL